MAMRMVALTKPGVIGAGAQSCLVQIGLANEYCALLFEPGNEFGVMCRYTLTVGFDTRGPGQTGCRNIIFCYEGKAVPQSA